MDYFNKRFLNILEQDDTLDTPLDTVGGEPSPDLGLDSGSDPAMFDDEVPDNPIGKLQDEQREGTITTLESWIKDVESFVEKLNGLDDNSINSQINKANCDSIMSDIATSESKKISRSAAELSALTQALKHYLQIARQKETSASEV
jgi:hypothetical protein